LAYIQGQPTKALKSAISSHYDVFTSPTAIVCVAMAAIEDDAMETDWATVPIIIPRREIDARNIFKNNERQITENPIESLVAAYLDESKSSPFL
jgi:hypothetical protein